MYFNVLKYIFPTPCPENTDSGDLDQELWIYIFNKNLWGF